MTNNLNSQTEASVPFWRSLRGRLLLLLLGVTAVTILVAMYLSLVAVRQAGQTALSISSTTVQEQTEEYLLQLTTQTARNIDLALETVRLDAKKLAGQTANLFDTRQAFANQTYWSADEVMFVGSEGQYINGPEDASTVFIPNTVTIDDEIHNILETTALLDFAFVNVLENDPSTVAIYYLDKNEVTRLYPNIGLSDFLPPDFLATQDVFYMISTPENNPGRETNWTPVYDDPAGQGLLVSASAPIYLENGEFLGIIGIDVALDQLRANIEANTPVAGAYTFLIDEQGQAIALPDQGYQDIVGRPPREGEFGIDLNEATASFEPILAKMKAGETGFSAIEIEDRELFVAYSPLESTGWNMATVIEAETVLTGVTLLQSALDQETQSFITTRLLPFIVGTLLIALFIGLFFTQRLIKPLQKLTVAAQAIQHNQWDTPLPVTGNDEVGLLSQTLQAMVTQMRDFIQNLEDRVRERTQALELESEISSKLTALLDVDEILNYVVNQLQTQFFFYHTHIYLIEEGSGDLVMAEGFGEVGQRLKEEEHRLPAGQGIVGTVASTNQPFVSNDVDQVLNFVRNRYLPKTKSELAVPLRKGEAVLGVLDIQSDQLDRFSQDTQTLLQSIANQTATAIDNARLLVNAQTSLQEVERLNRRLLGEAWDQFSQELSTTGYRFSKGVSQALLPGSNVWLPPMKEAATKRRLVKGMHVGNGEGTHTELAIPLILRDKVIGVLGVKREDTPDWAEEEISAVEAVANQVALALESARLSEERERTIIQLQDVDRIKSEFLTSMSHELRTPLNSIIGFADVIIQGIDGEVSDLALNDVKLIYNSGQHLLALINDILDISKIEAGMMELVQESMTVEDVINDVLAATSALLKDKPVEIMVDVEDDLPSVYADKLRLHQVILNLVSNAIKFTKAGTIKVQANLFEDEQTMMRISITDSGIGIPEDKFETIFSRFTQADMKTTREYGGTGLGLPICKQLIEMHGGKIGVNSTIGVGSEFYFTVPVSESIRLVK